MSRAWGGHRNGRIPTDALRRLQHATGPRGRPRALWLRRDASLALDRLLVLAGPGRQYVTDGYRSYADQVRLKKLKGRLAATPGTSNHGWALAADIATSHRAGLGKWAHENRDVMREHGWDLPAWAEDGRGIEEPWHFEYWPYRDQHLNDQPDEHAEDHTMYVKGDSGPEVAFFQARLNEVLRDVEEPIKTDGSYGPGTEAHVLSFQRLFAPDVATGRMDPPFFHVLDREWFARYGRIRKHGNDQHDDDARDGGGPVDGAIVDGATVTINVV